MNGIADHTSRKHVKHFFFKNIVYKNIKSIAQAQFFVSWKQFVGKYGSFHSYVKHSCLKEPSIKYARSDFVI